MKVNQLNGSCRKCTALPDSVKFRDFVQQAFNASDHTQWNYLSLEQLQSLLIKANHLITEHSNSGILPEIPGELLVKMFIHKKEEQALGIDEGFTHGWRRKISSLIVMD